MWNPTRRNDPSPKVLESSHLVVLHPLWWPLLALRQKGLHLTLEHVLLFHLLPGAWGYAHGLFLQQLSQNIYIHDMVREKRESGDMEEERSGAIAFQSMTLWHSYVDVAHFWISCLVCGCIAGTIAFQSMTLLCVIDISDAHWCTGTSYEDTLNPHPKDWAPYHLPQLLTGYVYNYAAKLHTCM